jgi:hypothetical protein
MRTLRLSVTLAALATVALTGCGSSDVTRARLERSLPPAFERLYVQQAHLLGHKKITLANLHAKAQCDKGGPDVADRGPGADWICQMTWHDPNLAPGTLPGKFEVNAHSNDCYTAGGPSKVVGSFTVTDTHGHDVDNPVFEFDVCFDPNSPNTPTGIAVATPAATATTAPPAALALPTGAIVAAADGSINPTLTCSDGDAGCAGTLTARLGHRALGTATYAIAPGRRATVHFHIRGKPHGTLTLTSNPAIGTAPTVPARLTIRQG